MTRRQKSSPLHELTQRLGSLDARSIDDLYGLEPVFEPGAEQRGVLPEQFVSVRCPWCGERLETRVDLTSDEAAYIEDCEVCCRPIEFTVERADNGALAAVRVQRLD